MRTYNETNAYQMKKDEKLKQLQEIAYAYKLPVEQWNFYTVSMQKIKSFKLLISHQVHNEKFMNTSL